MAPRAGIITYEVTNAGLGWAMVILLLLAGIERAFAGELLWTGMALVAGALGIVPPIISKRPTGMIAWETLGLAALPVVSRTLGLAVPQMTYLAVAALALVVVVELDAFTDVEMTSSFAIVFVVIVTMAVAGLWTIAQFVSDVYLGTSLLGDQNALMWDLVAATGVGVVAGLGFELYFRRLRPGHSITRESRGTAR